MKSNRVLQVHDELVFDVHKDELEQVKKIGQTGDGKSDQAQSTAYRRHGRRGELAGVEVAIKLQY